MDHNASDTAVQDSARNRPSGGVSWSQALKLCCVTGFLGGVGGVFLGAALPSLLGINARVASSEQASSSARLPVQLAMRPRRTGEGNVIQVKNSATSPLQSVVIRIAGPGRADPHTLQFETWQPGALAEIGEDDGWLVSKGQQLSISADGYPAVTITID